MGPGLWTPGTCLLPTLPVAGEPIPQHEWALVLKELEEVPWMPHFPGLLVFVNSRGFLYGLHRLYVYCLVEARS